jgi:hypothetical protein
MHQTIHAQPAADPVENWSQHLPGFKLIHIIYLASVASLDVVGG